MPAATSKKPKLPPGVLQNDENLKAQARELFETTDLSVVQIAARLGLKSRTTLVRWRNAESWERPTEALLMRRLSAAADVDFLPDTSSAKEMCQGKATENNRLRRGDVSPPSPDTRPDTRFSGADTEFDEKFPRGETDWPENADSFEIVSADSLVEAEEITRSYTLADLAEVQAKATRAQLRASGRLASVAHGMLEHLDLLMHGDKSDPRVGEALTRLIKINPDRETLQGIVKAVTVMMKEAVSMQRQALGQRNDALPPPGEMSGALPGQPVAGLTPNMRKVMEMLPEAELMRLRHVAAEVARSRPQPTTTIEGEAQAMPPEKEKTK